jgi:DNA-binding NarL/FixJ family response regulator
MTETLHLTKREREVLTLAAEGLTNREIAEKLFVCKRTADFHLECAYRKLQVRNRVQAINAARRRGLL